MTENAEAGSTEPRTTPETERDRLADRLRKAGVSTKRLIDVHTGEKRSTDHSQHGPESDALHGNYGVYAGRGADDDGYWLVAVDVDDYEASDDVPTDGLDQLPATLTVETPHTDGATGGHRYYAVRGDVAKVFEERIGARNPSPPWGEVRASNQYVVGPGSQLDGCDKEWCDECAEDDGGYYRIADDREIATLDTEEFVGAIVTDLADRDGDQDRATGRVSTTVNADQSTHEHEAEQGDDALTSVLRHKGWIVDYLAGTKDVDDRSAMDLAVCRELVAAGVSEEQARETLNASDHTKASGRGDDYWRSTWNEAIRKEKGTLPSPTNPGGETDETGSHHVADGGNDRSEKAWQQIRYLLKADEKQSTGEGRERAAHLLIEEGELLTDQESSIIWRYDPETGIYRDDGETWVRGQLRELGSAYSARNVRDIIHRIRSETYVATDELGADDPHLLCVENGVLDLTELREKVQAGMDPIETARELELRPHSPDYRFISSLDVAYDPDAYGDDHAGWDRWVRYIGERVEPRDIRNVQEYAGYCLHGDYVFKKAFLALGPHNSGKTTFLSAIHRLFPDEAVATEAVQDLTNNRFSAANLHGARVNIAGDLGTRELRDLERFKTLTGAEERMRAEIKGKQAYSFKPVAKYLWAANEVPEVNDPDDRAFINRWVFAEFPDEIEEPDDRVKQRLLRDETLRAVLLWALAGYATLFGWDGSNRGFSEERSIEDKRAIWNKHGDTIDQFIVECLELTGDNDDAIAVVDAYQAYREFCHHMGKPAESKRALGESILAQALVTDGQRRVDSAFSATNRPRCYVGVQYTTTGARYWEVAAGELSRDALDPSTDPDEWTDDREDDTEDSDGGPRGREDRLVDVMRSLGADNEPVTRAMILGRASASMDMMQAEYAFDALRKQGTIHNPPGADEDEWMLAT